MSLVKGGGLGVESTVLVDVNHDLAAPKPGVGASGFRWKSKALIPPSRAPELAPCVVDPMLAKPFRMVHGGHSLIPR